MATRAVRSPALLSAFVLHHYDWSESSLVLDLYTREQGRLAVVAKGAKRPYSQLRPVLLPFQRLQIALGKPPKADGAAPGEVQLLRAAEWSGGPAMLTGAALFSGFYLNELLMKLLPRNDAHEALFECYARTLGDLGAQGDVEAQPALRAFEVMLLKETGLLPELSLLTSTQAAVEPEGRYALLAEAGVAPARAGDTALSGQVLIGLQAALEHGSLAALQQACTPALPELKAVLRGLLHYHLGTPVLRTRQVMLDLQSLDRPLDRPSP